MAAKHMIDEASGRPLKTLTCESLQHVLGFKVADFQKYVPVFTHKSAMRITQGDSYERYEFIGDAVINFVVAKFLFDLYPKADEGFLTKVRTKLVSGKCLSELSLKLGLQDYVRMSERSLKSGFQYNTRILEDVFESLVGCVYLDLGLLSAKTFLLSVYERFIDFSDILRDNNYKDGLMRYAQARGLPLPDYVVRSSSSEGFTIDVCLNGARGCGVGSSKKNAEQEAARQLLLVLGCLTHEGDVNDVCINVVSSVRRPDLLYSNI
ncbi:hypothetical protein D9Q98_004088 [Chlorella vulgaris]|uniref:Uncharacterized protein n=1 Tax=Chlorella vulgaris TaxID=3077 RepID=A0A9D4TRA6_CHLVU|nr:hypothetical protein D9Q98_004088 [Chlorella vulgaris]